MCTQCNKKIAFVFGASRGFLANRTWLNSPHLVLKSLSKYMSYLIHFKPGSCQGFFFCLSEETFKEGKFSVDAHTPTESPWISTHLPNPRTREVPFSSEACLTLSEDQAYHVPKGFYKIHRVWRWPVPWLQAYHSQNSKADLTPRKIKSSMEKLRELSSLGTPWGSGFQQLSGLCRIRKEMWIWGWLSQAKFQNATIDPDQACLTPGGRASNYSSA